MTHEQALTREPARPFNDEDADLQDALLRGGETGRREVEQEEHTKREREERRWALVAWL
jgi:hypothetical protein